MKLVAIFMSAVTLVYLVYSFILEQQFDHIVEKTTSSPTLVTPAYISNTPLTVERVWQELKAERIKAKQPVEKNKNNSLKNKDVLTIGENKYVLYGIFNAKFNANKQHENTNIKNNSENLDEHSEQPFILIKNLVKKNDSEKAFMLKVIQGEELSKGVVLSKVSSNSISFKQNNELIEFKLFDAKK